MSSLTPKMRIMMARGSTSAAAAASTTTLRRAVVVSSVPTSPSALLPCWWSTASSSTTSSTTTPFFEHYHSRALYHRSFSSSSSRNLKSDDVIISSIIRNQRSLSTATAAAATRTATAAPPLTMPSTATTAKEFPSLVISSTNGSNNKNKNNGIRAIGAFAETTASFLNPDPQAVQDLADALITTKTGIVAHYYMDVELQSVLTAVAKQLPNKNWIGIADSLRMGDMAVDMATPSSSTTSNTSDNDTAATQILCLGVDFMAESVQAILTKHGFSHIPVYRADARRIGCSLAESAEQDSYRAWLQQESANSLTCNNSGALHVVYINTSLETKAVSSSLVPTITCTSSNVLQTLLQAAAQLSDSDRHVKILYGPDTYMGHNLQRLLEVLVDTWSDDDITSKLHARHNRSTLQRLRNNLHVFPSGNCIVHHMFGQSVVDTVQKVYLNNNNNNDNSTNDDNVCFVTAHLEVPGEMFEIAMTLSLVDRGVAGSTSDILKFIQRKVQQYANEIMKNGDTSGKTTTKRLRFILGTEAGMVTSIVQSVQQILNETLDKNGDDNDKLEVEIVFPVAQDAVMAPDSSSGDNSSGDAALPLVPGVSGGEGCSTAGGCATCPFMKMNDLDAVMHVLDLIQQQQQSLSNDSSSKSAKSASSATSILQKHLPPDRLRGRSINGQDAMDLGTQPILYMQQFMKDKKLPDELCEKVLASSVGKK